MSFFENEHYLAQYWKEKLDAQFGTFNDTAVLLESVGEWLTLLNEMIKRG